MLKREQEDGLTTPEHTQAGHASSKLAATLDAAVDNCLIIVPFCEGWTCNWDNAAAAEARRIRRLRLVWKFSSMASRCWIGMHQL